VRSLIIIAALIISGCSMTPTQKKWTAVGVGIIATGLVIAHETDNGRGELAAVASSGKGKGSFNPCPSGISRECK
jgi:hypothetical protein